MSDQSATLSRAITLGEILDVEACAGMLHAEFRDISNCTVTVESTIHNGEIAPIALFFFRETPIRSCSSANCSQSKTSAA